MKCYHRAEIETSHVLVALKFPGEWGGLFGEMPNNLLSSGSNFIFKAEYCWAKGKRKS